MQNRIGRLHGLTTNHGCDLLTSAFEFRAFSFFRRQSARDGLHLRAMTHPDASPRRCKALLLGALVVWTGWLSGCASPAGTGPWLASKPSMHFTEARAFNAPIRFGSQLEPGRVVSGGAQASVCTSCR